jgi:hypothetical protein
MVLLVAVLCAMSAIPADLVWCRGESGHNALELAWVGCCAPTGPDESRPTDGGLCRRTPGAAPSACTEGSCTDVLLSTAVALSPSPRPVAPPPVATSPFVILVGRSDSARSRDREVATAGSRQVRDLLRATVLTI